MNAEKRITKREVDELGEFYMETLYGSSISLRRTAFEAWQAAKAKREAQQARKQAPPAPTRLDERD